MFEIRPTKAYKFSNVDLFEKNGRNPVVTNSSLNNGVTGYTNLDCTEDGNIITYSDTTTSEGIFYQPNKFVGYSHIQGLYPLSNKNCWNKNTLLFMSSAFKSSAKGKFSYGNKFNRKIASDMLIQLPTKNNEIDFGFMESFVAELNAQRVAELNAYLTITGLKDYELTEEEKNLLENIDNIEYKELKIIDVFQVKNAGNILAREVELNSGDTPYLCASAENNSVSSYINYNRLLKDEGNCIFIGGKTFVVSYQEKDFYSNDSHNLALYLLDNEQREKNIQLFLSPCIKKSLSHKYSWGDSISNKKIQKDMILVPIKDGKIDYEIMKKVHRIIEKLVIKDVVLWADKKIEATKQVANR